MEQGRLAAVMACRMGASMRQHSIVVGSAPHHSTTAQSRYHMLCALPCRLYSQVDPSLDFSAIYKQLYKG